MTYQKTLSAITRRGMLVFLLVCSLSAFAHAHGDSGAPAAKRPVAKDVRATIAGAATRITIEGTAPMAYTVHRPAASLLRQAFPRPPDSEILSGAVGVCEPTPTAPSPVATRPRA